MWIELILGNDGYSHYVTYGFKQWLRKYLFFEPKDLWDAMIPFVSWRIALLKMLGIQLTSEEMQQVVSMFVKTQPGITIWERMTRKQKERLAESTMDTIIINCYAVCAENELSLRFDINEVLSYCIKEAHPESPFK